MTVHVIVGAGATARATAVLLAGDGDRVRMVSRSGGGPDHPLVERIAMDAGDADALARVADGATTVFNTAMPAYHTWPATIPPLFGAIMAAAERVGAGYVMLGNLYGYGPAAGPLTEDHPLAATGPKGRVRARMWLEAKAAHDAGRIRATEVRAGQFLGTGAISLFTLVVQPGVLAGRPVVVPSNLDTLHSFTAIDDAARALVAVARSTDAWGSAWNAPMITRTLREVATRLAELSSSPTPRLETMSDRELAVLGLVNPFWNELFETEHMSHREFVADSTRIEKAYGIAPSDLDDVLGQSLDS